MLASSSSARGVRTEKYVGTWAGGINIGSGCNLMYLVSFFIVICLDMERSTQADVSVQPSSRKSSLNMLTTAYGINSSSGPVRKESSWADVHRPRNVSGISGLSPVPNIYFLYSLSNLWMSNFSVLIVRKSTDFVIAKATAMASFPLSLIAFWIRHWVDQSRITIITDWEFLAHCALNGIVTHLTWFPGDQCTSKNIRMLNALEVFLLLSYHRVSRISYCSHFGG